MMRRSKAAQTEIDRLNGLIRTFTEDMERGRWDVQFFAWRFLGVLVHPGQVRFAQTYLRRHAATGWRPEFFDIAVSAGNRAGKTMALAIIVFHSCLYKMGSEPPRDSSDKEVERWRTRPYMAYHFAIKQEVANLLWDEIEHLLTGMHGAQDHGCPLADEFKANGGEQLAELDKKYNGEYKWIVLNPLLGGAEIHFRTTSGEKGTGTLGRDMHLISFDECGLEDNLLWMYENVLRHRRLGTGGQIIFISTPEEGFTDFSDFWFMGDPEAPDRQPRHMSLRMSTRENVGYGIDEDVFMDLVAGVDEHHIKQNIDGFFLQGRLSYFDAEKVMACFTDYMPEVEPAVDGGIYLQGVDPGLKDRCWSLVFRLLKGELYGVKAEVAGNSVETIVALAVSNHDAYAVKSKWRKSRAATAIDTTGLGGHMFRELVQQSIPEITSVEFGGNLAVKRKLLGDLKTLIEQGKLHCPNTGIWLRFRRQLLGFKLSDRHIDQDAVMAAVCAVRLIRRTSENPAAEGTEFNAYRVEGVAVTPKMDMHEVYARRRRLERGVLQ